MDQLNVEKKGIPTVTVVTTAFEEAIKAVIKNQDVAEIALVVTEHPIAGHNAEAIKKKADKDFPMLLKAVTQWPVTKK